MFLSGFALNVGAGLLFTLYFNMIMQKLLGIIVCTTHGLGALVISIVFIFDHPRDYDWRLRLAKSADLYYIITMQSRRRPWNHRRGPMIFMVSQTQQLVSAALQQCFVRRTNITAANWLSELPIPQRLKIIVSFSWCRLGRSYCFGPIELAYPAQLTTLIDR